MKTRARKILLIDDDYYFRLALEKRLRLSGHEPTCAEGVAHAKQLIGLEDFDLAISDIRMPDGNGIDLLKWIKETRPIPVILMTGFADVIETKEGAECGAHSFLVKPFKHEELAAAIESCVPEAAAEVVPVDLDAEFSPIGIDDFISGREMKFDIYIRISSAKYVKIAHCGENIDKDRIQAYKGKDVNFLHMKRDDFRKYLDFNLNLVRAVSQSDKIAHEKKIHFVQHTSEVLLQKLYTDEISGADFANAQTLVKNAVALLSDDVNAVEILANLAEHADSVYAHSVGVSLYASLIGRAMGWASPTTVFKLTVGGLLHDVGKKEIPKEVLAKPRRSLSHEEVKMLESHPVRGMEILAQVQSVPTDVLQIVHQHHENCLGLGYPSHAKKSKTHPMARVVSVANDFCNLVLPTADGPGMKPSEGIYRMMSLHPEHYDEVPLKALARLLHADAGGGRGNAA